MGRSNSEQRNYCSIQYRVFLSMGGSDFNFKKKFRKLTSDHLHALEVRDREFNERGRLESRCRRLHYENEELKRKIELLKMRRNELSSENKRLEIELHKYALRMQQHGEELELERSQRELSEEKLKEIQETVHKSTEDLERFREEFVQVGINRD